MRFQREDVLGTKATRVGNYGTGGTQGGRGALPALPCAPCSAVNHLPGNCQPWLPGQEKSQNEGENESGEGKKELKAIGGFVGLHERASCPGRQGCRVGRASKMGFWGDFGEASGLLQILTSTHVRPAPVSCPLCACPRPPTCNEGARWHGLRNTPLERTLRAPSPGPAPRVFPGFLHAGGQNSGFLRPPGKREHGQS